MESSDANDLFSKLLDKHQLDLDDWNSIKLISTVDLSFIKLNHDNISLFFKDFDLLFLATFLGNLIIVEIDSNRILQYLTMPLSPSLPPQ
jgi:hypothetical protein